MDTFFIDSAIRNVNASADERSLVTLAEGIFIAEHIRRLPWPDSLMALFGCERKLRPSNPKSGRATGRGDASALHRSILYLKMGRTSSESRTAAAKSKGAQYPKLINRTIAHSDKGTFAAMNKIYINILPFSRKTTPNGISAVTRRFY